MDGIKNWIVNKIVGPLPENALRAMPAKEREIYLAQQARIFESPSKIYINERKKRDNNPQPLKISFYPITAIVVSFFLIIIDLLSFFYVYLKATDSKTIIDPNFKNNFITLIENRGSLIISLAAFISSTLNLFVLCAIKDFHSESNNFKAISKAMISAAYGACHFLLLIYLFDRSYTRSGVIRTIFISLAGGSLTLGILGAIAGIGLKKPFMAVFIGSSDTPKKYLATGIVAGSAIGAALGNLVLLLDFVEGNETQWYSKLIKLEGGNLVPMVISMFIGKYIGLIYAVVRSMFYNYHEKKRIEKAQKRIELQKSIETLTTNKK